MIPPVAAPPAVVAPAPPASASAPLEFDGARLGMSLQAWKAQTRPGTNAGPEAPVCEPRPGAADVVACAWLARYGSYVLPEAAPLKGRYLARRPTYAFVGGRLACIEFSSSVDAFELLMATLKARYGPPTRVLHDEAAEPDRLKLQLSRVKVQWDLPAGRIRLVDPASDPDRLTVRIQAADAPEACSGAVLSS
jgi:hypothetical protein